MNFCFCFRYFNSIKVQLEQFISKSGKVVKKYFNSIKVQLELVALGILMLLRKFQFHKGTIRTISISLASVAHVISIP